MAQYRLTWIPAAAAVLLAALPAAAQPNITRPPSGDNQYAAVIQGIGPVRVTVEYSSPDVHSPTGEDRRGKIWGGLVPYGTADLGGFGCQECPWRGGANENTVLTTTHDLKVQGQLLPAGSYGLHFLLGPEQWTVIFSKNHASWGSYYYDPKEDALRVTAKPEKSEYHEWLTYEFTDRQPDRATLALKWEDLQLPVTLTVDNVVDLYIDKIRNDLRGEAGFHWDNLEAAARYCLEHGKNLDEALRWADRAVHGPGIFQESFATLTTLADLQAANGKPDEAKKTREQALNHRTAGPIDIHLYGRQLLQEKKNEEAMKVFELNARRHPNQWPVHLGLARGHAALGHTKEAIAEARRALPQAPDDASRKAVEAFIQQLEKPPAAG